MRLHDFERLLDQVAQIQLLSLPIVDRITKVVCGAKKERESPLEVAFVREREKNQKELRTVPFFRMKMLRTGKICR